MKSLLKFAIVAAGLALAATGTALSADAATQTPRPGRFLRLVAHRRAAMRQVAKKLDLTDAQKNQFRDLRAQAAATVRSIRSDATLTPEQKRARVRESLQATRGQFRAVLTPGQQDKLQKIRKHIRARARFNPPV